MGVTAMPGYVKPVFFIFLVIIAAGVIGGFMAADRGRRVALWCLLCALLPPFLLLLYFAKPVREVEGVFRKCSNCGELIKWHALACKYCKTEQTGIKTLL
jgi:cytochrome c oxidase subunit IV